jgi:hypothetical protein
MAVRKEKGMEKANNSKFLKMIGFMGFLGFLGFQPTGYSYLVKLSWISLLSLASLLVFVPFDKSKVKVPIDPKRKRYLACLGFLAFLGFLASSNPQIAIVAFMAIASNLAVDSQKQRRQRRKIQWEATPDNEPHPQSPSD